MKGARVRDETEAAAEPTAELAKDPLPGADHRETLDPDPTAVNELFFFSFEMSIFFFLLSTPLFFLSNSFSFSPVLWLFPPVGAFVDYIRRAGE